MTTPLNEEALVESSNAVRRIVFGEYDSWKIAEDAVSAYLAVAQPVVNSFDPRELNRRGWTCGCEPGNYDTCDECQSACNELAGFLNRPEVSDA